MSAPAKIEERGEGWLTDELVEPLAIAVCFAGFTLPQRKSAVEYWGGVSQRAKDEYREESRILLREAVRGSGALMPREPSQEIIDRYMKEMRLSNPADARKHFVAMRNALPTLWQLVLKSRES